jgi:hypothetical protein
MASKITKKASVTCRQFSATSSGDQSEFSVNVPRWFGSLEGNISMGFSTTIIFCKGSLRVSMR